MTAPLEQLHDILPGPQPKVLDEQSIILIAVSLLILFCLAALYKRWPRYKFYWRVKRELRVIIKKHPDNCIPAINLLLKKTANRFWPREQFAGLHTRDWLRFLDKNSSCQFSRFASECIGIYTSWLKTYPNLPKYRLAILASLCSSSGV